MDSFHKLMYGRMNKCLLLKLEWKFRNHYCTFLTQAVRFNHGYSFTLCLCCPVFKCKIDVSLQPLSSFQAIKMHIHTQNIAQIKSFGLL